MPDWWHCSILVTSDQSSTRVVAYVLEFFTVTQIWHFWHFCTKLTSRGFNISKNKVVCSGIWTHNTNHLWIRILTALTTQPPRHLLNRKSFQTLIKSCSIEPEIIKVQFKDFLFNKCLGGWMVKAVRILIPLDATLFLIILKPCDINFVQKCQKCQICVFFVKNSNQWGPYSLDCLCA